jgi:tagatose 1,6-diphosphate aldolase GatY/KbaY
MLSSMAAMLDGIGDKRAVGAFTCYDASTAAGVVRAAELRSVPVILLVSEASLRARPGAQLLNALFALAEASEVDVCVQLDHARDERVIRDALTAGIGAVLADGSALSVEQNIAFVRLVATFARDAKADVEAELGYIAGSEEGSPINGTPPDDGMTDPAVARSFVDRTGCDLLAISVGNRHGPYPAPPQLDWQRLEEIRGSVAVPLALHGGSGIPDTDLRRLVAGGIRKINVNTELRSRQFVALERGLGDWRTGYRMLDLQSALYDTAAAAAGERLDCFSGVV